MKERGREQSGCNLGARVENFENDRLPVDHGFVLVPVLYMQNKQTNKHECINRHGD